VCVCVCVRVSACMMYVMMCVWFEGEKKAQKFLPPAAGETPDPCHLSGPEMISYTFRHHTPGLAGGRRRRHGRDRHQDSMDYLEAAGAGALARALHHNRPHAAGPEQHRQDAYAGPVRTAAALRDILMCLPTVFHSLLPSSSSSSFMCHATGS
jgi:hypothetical protein